MPQNDDTTPRHEPLYNVEYTDAGTPAGPLGSAEAQIDVDDETYHRLHTEYCRAVDRGYSGGFETFVFNHTSAEYSVTVDGVPVDPDDDHREQGGPTDND